MCRLSDATIGQQPVLALTSTNNFVSARLIFSNAEVCSNLLQLAISSFSAMMNITCCEAPGSECEAMRRVQRSEENNGRITRCE